MMALRKTDTLEKKTVKVLLGQWGRARRTGWIMCGLGHKSSSINEMREATPIRLEIDDPELMQFHRAMNALKALQYTNYITLSLTYDDEMKVRDIARRHGVTENAVNKRIDRGIKWLEVNWQSAEFTFLQ